MGANGKLFEQLNKLRGTATVILGIGNTLKGDDGAACAVCQQLENTAITAEIIDAGTVPENYIHTIIKKAPQNLLVIDTVDFGAAPGEIKVFKPEQLNSLVISTHTLSPRLFVDIITKAIDINVYIIGIQPAQVQLGRSLSARVNQAAKQLTGMLLELFASE